MSVAKSILFFAVWGGAQARRCIRNTPVLSAAFTAFFVGGATCLALTDERESDFEAIRTLRVGAYVSYGMNIHTANFPATDNRTGAVCCAPFSGGTGWGATFGAALDAPIEFLPFISFFRERFAISLRAGIAEYSGTLRAQRDSEFVTSGGRTVLFLREEMSAALLAGTAEASLTYALVPAVEILAGVRVGVWYRKTYSRRATIEDPSGGALFANGERSQILIADATVPNVATLNLVSSALFGARYTVALNERRSLFAAPEIVVAVPILDIVPTRSWSVISVRAGIAFTFSPERIVHRETPSTPALDRLPPPLAPLRVAVRARPTGDILTGVWGDTTNAERANLRQTNDSSAFAIRTEEFASRSIVPLLPYVFFEQKSAEIPSRYKRLSPQETARFDERSFAGNEESAAYYHLLNILGARMRRFPSATVTITGCLGEVGFGPHSEENEPSLAQERANAVAAYLREVWGIESERLKTEARGLPKTASSSGDPLSAALEVDLEENRRVEIASDSWELLRPITLEDTLRIAMSGSIELQPKILSDGLNGSNDSSAISPLAEWRLSVEQSGRVLREFAGVQSLPNFSYVWQLSENDAPQTGDSVRYSFFAKDSAGRMGTAAGAIVVERLSVEEKRRKGLSDKEYRQFGFIGFDFERSGATELHKRAVAEYVRPALSANSTVTVTGYSDVIGNAATNQKLSEARAIGIARLMGYTPTEAKRLVKGLGGSVELYPNDTPEGRFYSRAVIVRIETPTR